MFPVINERCSIVEVACNVYMGAWGALIILQQSDLSFSYSFTSVRLIQGIRAALAVIRP